ncbi:MAG: magnesium protoporphyrin IX methyltransferase [Pseudomonadota bacterium]
MTELTETTTYQRRKAELVDYFDGTASDTWARLTSDAPVSGIRATVRAGRDAMRANLLDWLGDDLTGCRILDAGCGTGALSVDAAVRGADVVAVDISESLVGVARRRAPIEVAHRIDFRAGDMLDPKLGTFDAVVAMDSLIHYQPSDMIESLARLAARTRDRILFTHAPMTPLLRTMHIVGKVFPKGNKSPAIRPVSRKELLKRARANAHLSAWYPGRHHRVSSGFYISEAEELMGR